MMDKGTNKTTIKASDIAPVTNIYTSNKQDELEAVREYEEELRDKELHKQEIKALSSFDNDMKGGGNK